MPQDRDGEAMTTVSLVDVTATGRSFKKEIWSERSPTEQKQSKTKMETATSGARLMVSPDRPGYQFNASSRPKPCQLVPL